MLAWVVIIVKKDKNNKHVKGEGRVSQDAYQNNYDELVDNSNLLVEPITYLVKPKAYLEAYISIRKIPLKLTSSKTIISPSLFSFLFFGKMRGTALSQVGNSADSCGGINISRKLK